MMATDIRTAHVPAMSLLVLCFCLFQTASAQTSGLDFPGSDGTSSTIRFKFVDPHLNGLPIFGPNGRGLTYIWRAYPRRQRGYFTAFFWGNDDGSGTLDTFLWTSTGGADSYYGAHPYPQNGGPSGNSHFWEIAVEQDDYVNGVVEYDRWHTQALVVWADANGKHHEFYWDLPLTDDAHKVTRTSPTGWGNRVPPAPALTWGDAPWQPGTEVWSGILRGIQIYSDRMSLNDIFSEIANPGTTATGQASLWYLNLNPTPSDISDQSGNGNNPVWVGNERPSLYTDGSVPLQPNPPENLNSQ